MTTTIQLAKKAVSAIRMLKNYAMRILRKVLSKPLACINLCKRLLLSYLTVVGRYLTGVDALITAPKIVIEESLSAAVAFLKKRYFFYKPKQVLFLIQLYQFLQQPNRQIQTKHNQKPWILHFCCWGEAYANKAKHYLLPSLLAPGNLPSISKQRACLLLIHCDTLTWEMLKHTKVIATIKAYADVQFSVLPKQLIDSYHTLAKKKKIPFLRRLYRDTQNSKYILLGGLQTQALQTALGNQSFISFLMPDVLLSNAFFSTALAKITHKKAVLTTAFRTSYEKLAPQIHRFFTDQDRVRLVIDAQTLAELQIKYIHPSAYRRLVDTSTPNFASTAQLLFKTTHGFIVRAFHYHPILIDASQIDATVQLDYYPIDNTVLNQMVSNKQPYDQQLWICNDASELNLMEMSDSHIEPTTVFRKPLQYAELVSLVNDMIQSAPSAFDTPLNRYFCMTRYKVEQLSPCHESANFIDDQLFFANLTPFYQPSADAVAKDLHVCQSGE